METNSVNNNAKHQKGNVSENDVTMEVDENDVEGNDVEGNYDEGNDDESVFVAQPEHGLIDWAIKKNRENQEKL